MADKYGQIKGLVFADNITELKRKVKCYSTKECRPYGRVFFAYAKCVHITGRPKGWKDELKGIQSKEINKENSKSRQDDEEVPAICLHCTQMESSR
jgi:hypothetical protein